MRLRLGTRGSALALAQARLVADALGAADFEADVELVPIRTSGDAPRGGGPTGAGEPPDTDKSRFVKEIEAALLAGEIDLAVHSAKDVPSELPDGLSIVGVPERGDSRDALCLRAVSGDEEARSGGTLDGLPAGAVVGTSSLRRRAQILAARPDLEVRELRGNVDTRLRRLGEGQYDALVLAAAGLERLGRAEGRPISASEMTPAPGQGALALEAREGDGGMATLAGDVTDRVSLLCLTAERAVVARLETSCRTPVGAHAELRDGTLALSAFVGVPDGSVWIRDSFEAPADDAVAAGEEVAARLVSAGARDVLAAAERGAAQA